MGFVLKLHDNTYAVNGCTSGVLPLAAARLNWAIPTTPVVHLEGLGRPRGWAPPSPVVLLEGLLICCLFSAKS